MASVTLHAGEDIAVAAQRFIDAWESAERETPPAGAPAQTHITFESWAGLTDVLTPKRIEILRYVHRHPAATVAQVAVALRMNQGRVAEDVSDLIAAGLIDRHGEALQADYNEIRTAIAM